MVRVSPKHAAAGLAGLAVVWIGWGLYTKATTRTVDYTTLRTLEDAEIRRYPSVVLAETTAAEPDEAFERLYHYITGENETDSKVVMTAPVRTEREHLEIPMTGPVRSASDEEEEVRMGFYLPPEYSEERAPTPSDSSVELVVEDPVTVATRVFSWYGTEERVEENEERLLETLEANGIEPSGEPFLLRYSDPFTPPFLQRNEVAVEIE